MERLEVHPAYDPFTSSWNWLERFTRWREWGDGKQGFIHAFAWLALILQPGNTTIVTIISVCFSALSIMWAYLLNAVADKDEDRVIGKVHPFTELPWRWQLTVLMGLPVLLVVSLIILNVDFNRTVGLLGILLCGFLYSCHPLRGKNHWLLGPVLAAIGQRNFPVLLVTGWWPWQGFIEVSVHLLCVLVGLRWILVHYVKDYEADQQTNLTTTATKLGQKQTEKIILVGFRIEVVFLLGVTILAGVRTQAVWYVGAIWLVLHLPLWRFWRKWPVTSRLQLTAFAPLHDLYHAVAPIVLVWYVATLRLEMVAIAIIETILASKFAKYYFNLYRAAGVLPSTKLLRISSIEEDQGESK